MTLPEVLAIIPARGGSKGIPCKNLRLLGGIPLVAHTVRQAGQAASVSRVVVSTDDSEIAAAASEAGADVVWRPAGISGDSASSESALLHALDNLRATEDYEPEIVVFLQCTAPLTSAADIDGTVAALRDGNADTALAVVPFHYFLWKRTGDRDAVGVNHDKDVRLLRQEQEPQFLEAGAVYVMKAEGFRQAGHRFFGRTAVYEMPFERCIEIDDPVDLVVAEAMLGHAGRERKLAKLPSTVSALVMDFDGVFTDNRVLVMEDGREGVLASRGDGLGLDRLRDLNLPMLVLSTEENAVVRARCRKLRLESLQGIRDKGEALQQWLNGNGLDPAETVYVGNDINDLDCLRIAGCGVVVRDAHPDALQVADLVLDSSGGYGAVREICDLIYKQHGG